MELEQRIDALEKLVQKIIALPHLSNLAGCDSSKAVARLKNAIASDKGYLANTTPDYETRKEVEERITRNEFLISPALCADDNATTESPNEQAKMVKITINIDAKDIATLLKEPTIRAEIRKIAAEEANYRAWKHMKTTYPPELWQALQKAFPALLSDLPGERKPSHRPAESLSNP